MTASPLPDFVVIGARKCGTTWLDSALRSHPGVHLPTTTKELFFFDRYWDRGLDWYAAQFGTPPPDATIGEVTPSYLHDPEAPARLASSIPEVRLVVILRDPVDRAESDYHHALRKGDVTGSIEAAVGARPTILEESRYGAALERWLEYFTPDQLHITLFEQMIEDPKSALRKICAHVGAGHRDEWTLPPAANEARTARNPLLSKVAHAASRSVHRVGLHRAVGAGKRLGIGRLLEREGTDGLNAEDREWLRRQLDQQVPEIAGVTMPEFARYWVQS